ncbi:MAG: RagB/SusD family nutrient uptake outer membrane protein [Cyclobacteriaceae bacterium]|nr:RagB/SusD family nutrient uptake outer membrane protein [Cyclobacteriaceae bacterium]
MKKIIRLFTLVLALGIASCSEDYLEISDANVLSTSQFPTSLSHMELLLNAIYANQHSQGLYGMSYLGMTIYSLGNIQNMGWRNDDFRNQMITHEVKSGNAYLNEAWRDLFRGVQQCNTFLDRAPTIRESLTSDADKAKLNRLEGEVYFMRAWHYFMAEALFGESPIHGGAGDNKLGMPIITEPAGSFDEMRVSRATVRETWDFIISDLKEAQKLLAEAADEKRVTKWAVQSFLGKVYVYTEDWVNARTALKDVIDNSGKSLVDFATYQKMFYGSTNEHNTESIFEISLKAKPGEGWGSWGESVGTNSAMVFAPTFLASNGNRSSTGWGNSFPADENLQRFGFSLPAPTWQDNPSYDPDEKSGMDNYEEMPDPAFLANSRNLRSNQLADPRLWVSTRQVFEDSTRVDGSWFRIWPQHETAWDEIDGKKHAWSFNKYVNKTKSEYNDNVQNGNNMYWIRLADVYLLYAEAMANAGGDNAVALEYINKVHRRAYGLPVDVPWRWTTPV